MAEQKPKSKRKRRAKQLAGAGMTAYAVRLYATGRKAKIQAQVGTFRKDVSNVAKTAKKATGRGKSPQGSLFTTNKKGEAKKRWNGPSRRQNAKRAPKHVKAGYGWARAGGGPVPSTASAAAKTGAHIGRNRNTYIAAGGIAATGTAVYAYKRRKRKKAAQKLNRKGRK